MPLVHFTPRWCRVTATPEVDSGAATLRGALEDAFAAAVHSPDPAIAGSVAGAADPHHLPPSAAVRFGQQM